MPSGSRTGSIVILPVALASAITNRQWPHERCFTARFVQHNRCVLCAFAAGSVNAKGDITDSEKLRTVPIGSLVPRLWYRPDLEPLRSKLMPAELLGRIRAVAEAGTLDLAAFSRGLLGYDDMAVPMPAEEPTSKWVVRPEGGTHGDTIYTYGSRLDGPYSETARNGWAMVGIDSAGRVDMAAHGTQPSWIKDIPSTEAWAILQARLISELGTKYKTDCKPCETDVDHGGAWARFDRRKHARIAGQLSAAMDDVHDDALK